MKQKYKKQINSQSLSANKNHKQQQQQQFDKKSLNTLGDRIDASIWERLMSVANSNNSDKKSSSNGKKKND